MAHEETVVVGSVIDWNITRRPLRQRDRLAASGGVQRPRVMAVRSKHILAIRREDSKASDALRRYRARLVSVQRLHVYAEVIGNGKDMFSIRQESGNRIRQIPGFDDARFASSGWQQYQRSASSGGRTQNPFAVVRYRERIVVAKADRSRTVRFADVNGIIASASLPLLAK